MAVFIHSRSNFSPRFGGNERCTLAYLAVIEEPMGAFLESDYLGCVSFDNKSQKIDNSLRVQVKTSLLRSDNDIG